jgi:dihydrodipicolinate synthase/N-acetylneuraminate lyase
MRTATDIGRPEGTPGRLFGVFPMLVTPFTPAGEVDAGDLGRLVDHVIAEGAHGLSILGLGAEASRLTMAERRAIASSVLSRGIDRPIIVGCSAQETTHAVDLALYAAELGAAAVMLAPPSTARADRGHLRDHFLAVAQAIAPTPLMVQDAPAFIDVALDEAFVAELTKSQPNVQYAKPEGLPVADWVSSLSGAGLAVFGGHGGLYAMDVLEAGGVGLIPGCEAARRYTEIFDAYTQGKVDEAWRLFTALLPLAAFQFQGLDFYIACVKRLLTLLGVIRHDGLRGLANPLGATAVRLLRRRAALAGLIPTSAV